MGGLHKVAIGLALLAAAVLWQAAHVAASPPCFLPSEVIQAGGSDLAVPGYSVPCYEDWDNDGRKDLIVGEGGGGHDGKLRVYLNVGTAIAPEFSGFSYVQRQGTDLVVPGSGCPCAGCLGAFPRMVDWNDDGKKDLAVGTGSSGAFVYLNSNPGPGGSPIFALAGVAPILYGPPGSKSTLNVVSARTTLDLVDWDNDGLRDVVTGALDGKIRVFLNEGTPAAPDFLAELVVQDAGGDLVVPSERSSPVVMDLDDDGRKDLLIGNTLGEILFYSNQGTDAAPSFSSYSYVRAGGEVIDLTVSDPLASARSRPFVTDWTGDGLLDLLVGASDGKVILYQGAAPEPTCLGLIGFVLLALRKKKA